MWKFLRILKGSSGIGWICLGDWWAASQNDWPRFGLGVAILGSLVIYIYILYTYIGGPTCKNMLGYRLHSARGSRLVWAHFRAIYWVVLEQSSFDTGVRML